MPLGIWFPKSRAPSNHSDCDSVDPNRTGETGEIRSRIALSVHLGIPVANFVDPADQKTNRVVHLMPFFRDGREMAQAKGLHPAFNTVHLL